MAWPKPRIKKSDVTFVVGLGIIVREAVVGGVAERPFLLVVALTLAGIPVMSRGDDALRKWVGALGRNGDGDGTDDRPSDG